MKLANYVLMIWVLLLPAFLGYETRGLWIENAKLASEVQNLKDAVSVLQEGATDAGIASVKRGDLDVGEAHLKVALIIMTDSSSQSSCKDRVDTALWLGTSYMSHDTKPEHAKLEGVLDGKAMALRAFRRVASCNPSYVPGKEWPPDVVAVFERARQEALSGISTH